MLLPTLIVPLLPDPSLRICKVADPRLTAAGGGQGAAPLELQGPTVDRGGTVIGIYAVEDPEAGVRLRDPRIAIAHAGIAGGIGNRAADQVAGTGAVEVERIEVAGNGASLLVRHVAHDGD